MRKTVLGALVGAAIVVVAAGASNDGGQAFADRPNAPDLGQGQLIAFSSPATEAGHQITVIDPKTQVMAVYQVDAATGAVSLQSVRALSWDLQLSNYNTNRPLPGEIRSTLEQN